MDIEPSPAHERIAEVVRTHFADDSSGHDMAHAWRVYNLGNRLSAAEGADFTVVGAAALVHDVHRVRGEGFTHPKETLPEIREILDEAEFSGDRDAACHCVAYHEEYDFAAETDLDHEPTVEERVLRDADNLDALGAIGIGRTFAYGGASGRPMYDSDDEVAETYVRGGDDGSVVQHIREKLLRLPDAMETETGRELAADRAAFVESFVERFEAEWTGEQ